MDTLMAIVMLNKEKMLFLYKIEFVIKLAPCINTRRSKCQGSLLSTFAIAITTIIDNEVSYS